MGMCLMSLINVYVALNLARVENVKLANVLKGNKGRILGNIPTREQAGLALDKLINVDTQLNCLPVMHAINSLCGPQTE